VDQVGRDAEAIPSEATAHSSATDPCRRDRRYPLSRNPLVRPTRSGTTAFVSERSSGPRRRLRIVRGSARESMHSESRRQPRTNAPGRWDGS
jgi:hypothetical protein